MSKKAKGIAMASTIIILVGCLFAFQVNKGKITIKNNTDTITTKLYISDDNGKKLMEISPIDARSKKSVKVPKGIETENVRVFQYYDDEQSYNGVGLDGTKSRHTQLIINAVYDDGLMDIAAK